MIDASPLDQLARARVSGAGHCLPGSPVSNDQLIRAHGIDSNHDWIVRRTGIEYRHFVDKEKTSDLAVRALDQALARAGKSAQDIDEIILATTTADNIFPSTASKIQHMIGARSGIPAFDIQAVCAGFVFALSLANDSIRLGRAETVAVIGADTYSHILDWRDRSTCVLFGDGAGAFVVTKDTNGNGVKQSTYHADGAHHYELYVDGGVAAAKHGHVRMEGKAIFIHGVKRMAEALVKVAEDEGVTVQDLDLVVPHQANKRIIDRIGENLKLSPERVISTVSQHANVSAATIPLAVSLQYERFQPNMRVGFTALGGGLAWGANLLNW